MSDPQLLEKEFEDTLCDGLAARGWLYEDGGAPAAVGWDIARAMVPGDVLHWLATQYPDEYEKAVPSDLVGGALEQAQTKLLEHIIKELRKPTRMDPISGHPVGGLLGVLRKGFSYAQVGRPSARFGPLVAFPPANPQPDQRRRAVGRGRWRCVRCASTRRRPRRSTSSCAPTACRWSRSS